MLKKYIYLILLLITYLLICNKIYIKYKITSTKTKLSKEIIQETKKKPQNIISKNINQITHTQKIDNSIGSITISKINLSNKLYPLGDELNNIEKNVTILNYSAEPKDNDSIIFIAAHSGTGKLAYFKNLHKLKINDIINLEFKNKHYTYKIKDIWEIKKEGNISVEKEDINQLILTTCSPTKENYQLIINSILIQKES